MQYTINGQHTFTFIATAEVVPMGLQLDKEALSFEFAADNTGFSVTQPLLLTNPFTVPVDFWFTNDNEAFHVSPVKGTVAREPARCLLLVRSCSSVWIIFSWQDHHR